jgi:hypothetical protein
MSTNVIQPSFAAGELSPSLYARVDLGKYHVGAELVENFIVDFKGGVFNRPGTKFMQRVKGGGDGSVRLIEFQFSTVQSYILEFGHQYIRFYAQGAPVLESSLAITAITQAAEGKMTIPGHNYVSGDWIVISNILGMTQLNGKTVIVDSPVGNTFGLLDLDGNPIDTTFYNAYVSGGTAARVYTLSSPYASSDLALIRYVQSADVLTLTHTSYPIYNLNRFANTNWSLTTISVGSSMTAPAAPILTQSTAGSVIFGYVITAVDSAGQESIASSRTLISSVDISTTYGTILIEWSAVAGAKYYRVYKTSPSITTIPIDADYGWIGDTFGLGLIDDNITPDFTISPPRTARPFANGSFQSITVLTNGTGYSQGTVGYTINTTTGSGAVLEPIIRYAAGNTGVTGVVIKDPGHDYLSTDTITITDSGSGSGATVSFTVSSSSGNNPGSVAYFQQRRVYAGSINNPETLWMSQPGNFNNFNSSNPVKDDDAIIVSLASKQVNNIKYMVGMPGGLIVLTGSSAWQISGGQANQAVTPASIVATPQAYTGCADLPPIVINYDILFVQARGNVVRDLSYNFYVNIYTGIDISLLSNHLLIGYQLREWAYCEEPFKVVWAVRSDGELLSMTYLKEQEVYGWAHHHTAGLFKSVASVQEGTENVLYCVVERYIEGKFVKYVERMASRTTSYGVEDSWFLDCALTNTLMYPSATITASAYTGTGVDFETDLPIFSSDSVNSVIRMGGGIATITQFISTTRVKGNITRDIQDTLYGDNSVYPSGATVEIPLPQSSGNWSMTAPLSSVSGLDHLEGQTVGVFVDGSVQTDKVVTNGSITLDTPGTKILVGIRYAARLKTLRLDVGDPTVQGKRKKISALTVRTQYTRGLKMGSTWNTLVEYKMRNTQPMGSAIEPVTGDQRIIMDPSWNVEGQICIRQDYPLPATVLGVIPEIVVGDTPSK